MESHTRERISIDLQGLKGLLLDRSQALGMSPSTLVRTALVQALGVPAEPRSGGTRVRAAQTAIGQNTLVPAHAPRRHSDHPGCCEASRPEPWQLCGGVGGARTLARERRQQGEQLAALTGSNAHLADLSRNIHALTRLLTQSNVPKALVYRDMLDTLDGDVRRHLAQAAALLADLRPRGAFAEASRRVSR